ncbi:hypothetical protein J2T56_001487 [Natronobacillus azotifigens]
MVRTTFAPSNYLNIYDLARSSKKVEPFKVLLFLMNRLQVKEIILMFKVQYIN